MAEHEEGHGGEEHGEGGHGGGGHGGGHGGGGGHAEGEHEGAPEWLISFADNVALMMGFFVILLAMNMGPKGNPVQGGDKGEVENYSGGPNSHVMDMILSIREGFNNPPTSDNPEDRLLIKRMIERTGGEATQDGPKGRFQEVQASRPSDYRQVTAVVPFPENSGILNQSGRDIIRDASPKLRDQPWIIEIRGHASQFEAKRSLESSMRLSYDRAMAVARALVEVGVKKENFRVVACGDNDRLVAKTFEAESARTNQRVEIVITNESVQGDAFSKTVEDGKAAGGGAD